MLLLRNRGLVKSVKFKDFKYIGDPINAVRIFNDKRADELVFLDIVASLEHKMIELDFVKKVGEEANMPFAVGGGINQISHIREILHKGAEKVVLNTVALNNPNFVKVASDNFGSSTITICIDVKKNIFGRTIVYNKCGAISTEQDPISFAQEMEYLGAGEIIIQSIDRDGCYTGYDIPLIKTVSDAVTIPVVALGGAGHVNDFVKAVRFGSASAVAAGSIFIYHGPRKAVLINFPTQEELSDLFKSE